MERVKPPKMSPEKVRQKRLWMMRALLLIRSETEQVNVQAVLAKIEEAEEAVVDVR